MPNTTANLSHAEVVKIELWNIEWNFFKKLFQFNFWAFGNCETTKINLLDVVIFFHKAIHFFVSRSTCRNRNIFTDRLSDRQIYKPQKLLLLEYEDKILIHSGVAWQMTIGERNRGKAKVFSSEASKEHEDVELSSISLFKAHGIIYICNKIIVNKVWKIYWEFLSGSPADRREFDMSFRQR